MKKILLIFVAVIGFGIMAKAQDVILKQDGSEIKAKVTEITDQQIKYKDFDFQSGPTRNINISDVFMITYENGQKEVFKKPIETKETLSTSSDEANSANMQVDNSSINSNFILKKNAKIMIAKDGFGGIGWKVLCREVKKQISELGFCCVYVDGDGYIDPKIDIVITFTYVSMAGYRFKIIDKTSNMKVFDKFYSYWKSSSYKKVINKGIIQDIILLSKNK